MRLDLFPDEVYVFTPEGRREGPARGLDADRLRLRRAHRRRPPLRRRQGQRQARAAALHAPAGRHRRDRHLADPAPEPRLAQDRQVRHAPAPRSTSGSRSRSASARSRSGRELFEREAKKYRLSPRTLLGVRRDARRLIGRARLPLRRRSAGRRWATARPRCSRCWASSRPRRVHEADSGPDARRRQAAAQGRAGRCASAGVDDLLVRFAKCCSPVPGDGIVGFITRGRGLTVHARDCLTVVKNVLDKERLITRGVGRRASPPSGRSGSPSTSGSDRPGLLAEITGAISSRHGNITKAEVTVTDDRQGHQPLRGRGRRPAASSRRSCRPSARCRTSSTSSASAACESGADDSGPSASLPQSGRPATWPGHVSGAPSFGASHLGHSRRPVSSLLVT